MATEVKYLSDTLRMIRNCEISPQRAREEVRFLINLIDARIAAAKAKPPVIDVDEWADKWQKATDEYDGPMRGRRAVQIQFIIDLIRAATAADKAEQPAPAPAGDVPEWCIKVAESIGEWSQSFVGKPYVDALAASINHAAESEIARRVAEATKERDAEIERLKAELTEARTPIPEGEPLATIGDFQTCLQRERAARLAAERDSKDAGKWLWKFGDAVGCDGGWGSILNEVIALRLRAEAATTKPVDFESARTVELDGMKMIYLGDAQAAVRCERAARIAAEKRLSLTREAWRHRWVDGGSNGRLHFPRTDADIDAAIEAHEKSKADAAGGQQ